MKQIVLFSDVQDRKKKVGPWKEREIIDGFFSLPCLATSKILNPEFKAKITVLKEMCYFKIHKCTNINPSKLSFIHTVLGKDDPVLD
jgi:hypothetical protein